ncbi:MAG: hypothetical protein A2Z29_01385 [Chloroflexi bacterium RBG_16_56_11]|nr:MAG: hypothetical protein A2Z29_01385 [Chloroflexi bacterium RBG_16_56_11]
MVKNKIWFLLFGVVLLVGVVALAGCDSAEIAGGTLELKGNLNNQQEGIWVNGEGKVTAVPDVAILSLGIEAQETTVAVAQASAAAAMDTVMKALKDKGIADKDIQTQYFNIQRVTRWDNDKQQEVVIGYRVTNTVTAKIRDVAKSGSIIDAVVVAGGDLTRVNSIGFQVDNPAPFQEQARDKAVANAADKAKKLADAAGVKLGKPVYITESSFVPGPIFRADLAKAEGAPVLAVETPISPGETEITVNVQINYAIAD